MTLTEKSGELTRAAQRKAINRAFGKKMRELRRRDSLTQKELGVILGVARSTIAEIESGRRRVTFVEAIEICEYFDYDMEKMTT